MDSYGMFHPDTHLRTPTSKFWTPNHSIFIEKSGPPDPPEALFDFPETIPAYLNFAAAHIICSPSSLKSLVTHLGAPT